jgi:nucleoside-diphosphate-sugar epimerase
VNILLTGGCGFTGSILTHELLKAGHELTVIDMQWFGNYLGDHPNLRVLKMDARETGNISLDGVQAIVHLANIANDPGVELNPALSWEVNVLATQQLADRAVRAGVQHFVYASSGSVYGVKDEPNVTEDLELVPITAYNKTKMVAERVLLSYADKMQVHCVRPATVCGVSPRMRFDVSVNLLTLQALRDGNMTVFGGDQVRPNIHIDDIVAVYGHFLEHPDIPSGAYNAGFENISIASLASMVADETGATIKVSESNDPRSYRQDSTKLLQTGFTPRRDVHTAILDIIAAYGSGQIQDRDEWHTVRWMKHLRLGA